MKNLRTLKKYFLRYKTALITGIFFIIVSNAFTVYVPIIIKDSLNDLQQGIAENKLVEYALLIVGSTLMAGIFRFMIRQTIIVISRKIEYDLRQDFWEYIQHLSLRFFQNNSTGNIMAHATNDISAVRMFIGPAVMYSIDTGVRIIIVISIMSMISWEVTLWSLIPLPFLSFLVYVVGKKVHKRFTLIQEKFADLTTKAQENFSGIRVIKSYVAEEREVAEFDRLSREYLARNMKLVKIQALFQPTLFLITGMSIIIAIWAGGTAVINKTLMIGDVTALIMYLGILIWPMIAFGWVINIIQQAEASMARLNKLWSEELEIADVGEENSLVNEVKGEVEFRNVSFKYGENLPFVLQNLNLKIPAGHSLAIMGNTGSGKTTMINLIPRLFDATEGEVLLDGVNIKDISLKTVRRSIGFVPQEAFLFSETIKNNICYGKPDATESEITERAKIAQFSKDVLEFPEGFETVVGERGITLSGGQKQRASLTRALMTDPEILILDDSFSAVDTHTEEDILQGLRGFMKNRTTLMVSHRVSTVKDADKIVILDKGMIAEEGTHDELIKLNGLYAGIYNRQLLEQEIEEI
ncbi:MAG: ABC transporter ATP-binding protein [Ignavibacteriales bacterium]|jgi:ATP-binding cassette subfamily B multidrug efflux pump|nr:ABC transporter ATP-binding protein [Ignavibacteriales bacterium]MBK7267578.1 ABC transporter ATP-binding protein [Ignavibacteriales bacterium]MBP7542802.1 ABC transporter ATP-binding protein [Ignavibacteriaceae bacterium]